MPFIQHKILELLGVSHPPHTIVLFDQLIAGADVGGRHLFLRGEFVFDDFKHPVKARQGKHQHHHAADPRRFNKLLIAMGKIEQIFAVTFGLRVFLTANRHVQFGGGFTGQDLAQPLHQRRGQRSVNHKIGAGEAKHNARLRRRGQTGIDKQFAFISPVDWQ